MKKKATKFRQPVLRRTERTTLRFSPTAWAKLLFLRDCGGTEVGGFGIASSDDLLYVEDVQLVGQTCSFANVRFDDEAVADFFDRQVDAGRQPEEFARIWAHTHPADSASPSLTDEETFERVFGNTEWALMFILAQGGQTYARLRFNVGPGGAIEIPVEVDYRRTFAGSDFNRWEKEYLASVRPEQPTQAKRLVSRNALASFDASEDTGDWQDAWFDYLEDPDEQLVRKDSFHDVPA